MKDFVIPEILQCSRFIATSNIENKRIVRDYEFDFFVEGERDVYLDGKHYNPSKGSLMFRKPGQIITGTGDYNMYILTLDFSGKSPIKPEQYIRSSFTPEQEICHPDFFEDIPDLFFPYHQEEIIELYKIMSKNSYPNVINRKAQHNALSEFLFLVLADSMRYRREIANKKTAKSSYIERACNYITRNYSKNLNLNTISDYLSLNKNYLIKLFKKELSVTPNQYIASTRLFYAKLMLTQTELSVQDIAVSCGFNTTSYFIKCFKEKYGVTPTEYKKNLNKEENNRER